MVGVKFSEQSIDGAMDGNERGNVNVEFSRDPAMQGSRLRRREVIMCNSQIAKIDECHVQDINGFHVGMRSGFDNAFSGFGVFVNLLVGRTLIDVQFMLDATVTGHVGAGELTVLAL